MRGFGAQYGVWSIRNIQKQKPMYLVVWLYGNNMGVTGVTH